MEIPENNWREIRENEEDIINKIKDKLPNPIIIDEIELKKIKENNHDKCVICLEDFAINDKIINLECSHLFHNDCILKWFVYKSKCPLCKKQYNFINNEYPIEYYIPEFYIPYRFNMLSNISFNE